MLVSKLVMKKLLSIFLFSIILLKIGGFVAILNIGREWVRESVIHKIKHHLSPEDIKCIIINESNQEKLKWEKQNKEFWFDGKLYDILSVEEKSDSKYYYCLSDEKEQNIISQIQNLTINLNSHLPLNNTSKNLISLILQPTILFESYSFNLKLHFNYIFTKLPPITSFYHSSHIFELINPPQSN